jgi:hypothetical protein
VIGGGWWVEKYGSRKEELGKNGVLESGFRFAVRESRFVILKLIDVFFL